MGTMIAVALSVMAAGSYAAAAVLQERLAAAGHRGRTRWVVALLLTAAGAGLHVAALAYGTVAVVQALGALTLLFALPIAAIRTRTRVSAAGWRGAALTVAGLAAILTLAQPGAGTALPGRHLTLAALAAVITLALLGWQSTSATARALLLAAASGTAFAVGSVFTKAMLTGCTWPEAVATAVFSVCLLYTSPSPRD